MDFAELAREKAYLDARWTLFQDAPGIERLVAEELEKVRTEVEAQVAEAAKYFPGFVVNRAAQVRVHSMSLDGSSFVVEVRVPQVQDIHDTGTCRLYVWKERPHGNRLSTSCIRVSKISKTLVPGMEYGRHDVLSFWLDFRLDGAGDMVSGWKPKLQEATMVTAHQVAGAIMGAMADEISARLTREL